MARWNPGDKDPIGPSEYIARRLFDEPRLFGAADQAPLGGLSIHNFLETRSQEFSLDRVGKSSIDKKVIRYLTPRAHHAATTFHDPTRFDGWVALPARALAAKQGDEDWDLFASPDHGPVNGDGQSEPWSDANIQQNLYHAHIVIPANMPSKYFAFCVRERFAKGKIERAAATVPSSDSKPLDSKRRVFEYSWARRLPFARKLIEWVKGSP
jgi:hypothetical protein